MNKDVSSTTTINVNLADRSYPIVIGPDLLEKCGDEISQHFPSARIALVSDDNVAPIYLDRVMQALSGAGNQATPVIIPAGETSKSFDQLQNLVDQILAAKIERGDIVAALGGGVIGDLTGFAASITRRGVGFVQLPTTLLAQVDSSVGGKTGINSPRGKNLIGAFYQPQLVLADTTCLDTLPKREFAAGYAEIVKYGLIDRPEFFNWLEANWQDVFAGNAARIRAIATSCQAKADIVARDEREAGERALLNLGHTFGHALEAATNYDPTRLVHGEGVAIGMALAHRFSAHLGLISLQDVVRVEQHLQAVGLPSKISDIPGDLPGAEGLMKFIAQDKKVERGALTFILTRGLGEACIAKDVPGEQVITFLNEVYSQ